MTDPVCVADGNGGIKVGLYAAGVAVVVLGGLGALASIFRQPYLFPSIGPTVMVLAERPRSASAHPRNVLVGHGVAIIAGLLALVVFGLWHAPPVTSSGVGPARTGAVIVSLAVTAMALQWVRVPHAPAGATTLIVSLGLLKTPRDLVAILTAIAFVALVATSLNLETGRRRTLRLRPTSHRVTRNFVSSRLYRPPSGNAWTEKEVGRFVAAGKRRKRKWAKSSS